MSSVDLERFRSESQENPHLLQELSALVDDFAALGRWAAEKGFDLTPSELNELAANGGELSDEELEQAAGGWTDPPPPGAGGGG